MAPCVNKDKSGFYEEYLSAVNSVALFLEGRTEELILSMKKKMKEYSLERKYEKAMELKNRIDGISSFSRSNASLISLSRKTPITSHFLKKAILFL